MYTETIVGVMGPGSGATSSDKQVAYELGKLIAGESWVLLTGGRQEGVMDASLQGAAENNGKTIGVLPGTNAAGMSAYVQFPIFTGMGHGRNAINILSSRVIFACGLGAGTSSEISLAIKTRKPTILLNQTDQTINYFGQLSSELIYPSESPGQAVEKARDLIHK